MKEPVISVIIPQRNSTNTIPRLLNTIPDNDNIEVLVVDNSFDPISKNDILSEKDFKLLWSPPSSYAGGARNKGLENATGKWLIFADSDDYFEKNAFDIFMNHINDDSDVIFFYSKGIYVESGLPSHRSNQYNKLIDDFLNDSHREINLRINFSVPWAKMIRREFVNNYNIEFDEVIAANDAFFSLLTGFYAGKVSAYRDVVYVVTTNKGSLTKRKDNNVIWSRFVVGLRKNKFLKENGLGRLQSSIFVYIYESRKYGIVNVLKYLITALKYRQNIFVGCSRWFDTYKKTREIERKDSRYYTR